MIRDVQYLPLLLAARLRADAGTVVVSILDGVQPAERPSFAGFRDVLALTFMDLDEQRLGHEPGAWPSEPSEADHRRLSGHDKGRVPSLSDARAIVDFLWRYHGDPLPVRVVVHCLGGTSRSAAVAAWAASRFGVPLVHLTAQGTADANRRLLRLLEEADAARTPTA